MMTMRTRRPAVTIAQLCAAIDRGVVPAREDHGVYSVKYGDVVRLASLLRTGSFRRRA